jgi:hypothetical protein
MHAETVRLLTWLSAESRSYPEAIEVWHTHCPRHSVWEDAVGDELIRVVREAGGSRVVLTERGEAALKTAGSALSAADAPGVGL